MMDPSLLLSAADVVDPAVAAAADAASQSGNGWFGFLTGPIEMVLQGIHTGYTGVGMDANSWGLSIVTLTVVIKLLTYPLTKGQLESTTKMQAVQPRVKELQATYASNPEIMNKKIQELYSQEDVQPLAGCIPSLVQLPVFIGLYRAVFTLAKENKLDESFLWLPSLEGPVYGADPAHGTDWILKNWDGTTPSLGWHDTLAFLSLPIMLVVSQLISQELMQPKPAPGAPQSDTNAILKFLPFLIGWFSVGVPSALGIYWVINNLITTALSLQIRSSLGMDMVPTAGGAATLEPEATFTPLTSPVREKPSGFSSGGAEDGVNPITAVDAEIIQNAGESMTFDSPSGDPPMQKKPRGKRKKKKRK